MARMSWSAVGAGAYSGMSSVGTAADALSMHLAWGAVLISREVRRVRTTLRSALLHCDTLAIEGSIAGLVRGKAVDPMSQPLSIDHDARPTSPGPAVPIILPGADDQAAAYAALLKQWADADEAEDARDWERVRAALQETRRAAGERLLFPE